MAQNNNNNNDLPAMGNLSASLPVVIGAALPPPAPASANFFGALAFRPAGQPPPPPPPPQALGGASGSPAGQQGPGSTGSAEQAERLRLLKEKWMPLVEERRALREQQEMREMCAALAQEEDASAASARSLAQQESWAAELRRRGL